LGDFGASGGVSLGLGRTDPGEIEPDCSLAASSSRDGEERRVRDKDIVGDWGARGPVSLKGSRGFLGEGEVISMIGIGIGAAAMAATTMGEFRGAAAAGGGVMGGGMGCDDLSDEEEATGAVTGATLPSRLCLCFLLVDSEATATTSDEEEEAESSPVFLR
jgi:hypothetical protein